MRLSLFYDFRELTPIGRRGDELVRRLVDRLVSIDLLDQAADLLLHQVDNRLTGTAKAQIAADLALIYLMDYRPSEAVAVLQRSRVSQAPHVHRTRPSRDRGPCAFRTWPPRAGTGNAA
jgi:hypothetical protein